MSAKQLRKLQALRELEGKAEDAKSSEAPDSGEASDSSTPAARPTSFAALLGSDSDPDEEREAEPCSAPVEAAPPPQKASARRQRRKSAAKDENPDEEALLEAAAAVVPEERPEEAPSPTPVSETGVLAMRRADFSVENERRRVMGLRSGTAGEVGTGPRSRRTAARPRGAAEGRVAHHRRLCIVTLTAEEPWPRPDGNVAMVADTDAQGAVVFDFEETPASKEALEQLRRCLYAQDPQLLLQFLQRNPFCVDGLLTLAEHYRSQHSHEQAFQLTRRATYAVECGFNSGFSPFHERGTGAPRPNVVLRLSDDLGWPGWSWLRALWMHTQGLAGQGLHRTALEGCKLLLAATLPRDPAHALFCCDYFCLRSRHYDLLARIARLLVPQYGLGRDRELSGLDLVFPNFAYSLALAGFLKAGKPPDAASLGHVSLDDVVPPEGGKEEPATVPEGAALHAQLMRALLLFPQALRPLLEQAGAKLHLAPGGSPSRQTWAELLTRAPFSNSADFRHSKYAAGQDRLCGAYAKRCGSLWHPDLVLRWLHSCAARLVSMHEAFSKELSAKRSAWCSAPLCLGEALAKDYPELLPDEGASEAPKLPPALEKAAQARLHPPQWRHEAAWDEAPRERPPPTMSIFSPPLLVFFQSMLPWSELDRSGVRVKPLRWADLGWAVANAFWNVGFFVLGVAADLVRLAIHLAKLSEGWLRRLWKRHRG